MMSYNPKHFLIWTARYHPIRGATASLTSRIWAEWYYIQPYKEAMAA